MDLKVGDSVVQVSSGNSGVIIATAEKYPYPYQVQWAGFGIPMWQSESEIKPVLPEKPVVEDVVNHPAHYNTGKIEVIDFIEDQGLEYHEGNAVKYISRAGKKNPDTRVEDLQKAVWYLTRLVNTLLKGENDG